VLLVGAVLGSGELAETDTMNVGVGLADGVAALSIAALSIESTGLFNGEARTAVTKETHIKSHKN
jgi:hypothetical protein